MSARVKSAHCTPGIQSIAAAQEMPALGKVQCVLHSAITFRGKTLGRPHLFFFFFNPVKFTNARGVEIKPLTELAFVQVGFVYRHVL